MEYKRILAVGDIHGNFERLLSLYEKIEFDPAADLLIFLGDYIDRGPDNLRVLDWVRQKSQEPNVIALRGNHEQMMLDYFQKQPDGMMWRPNGGDATYREIKQRLVWEPDCIRQYLAFLKQRPCSYAVDYEGQPFFFCHAGVRSGIPLTEQSASDLLWIRSEFYRGYSGDTMVIAGHTPVPMLYPGQYEPIFRQNRILLDTGSFLPAGRISCVDVLTWKFWQSEDGR